MPFPFPEEVRGMPPGARYALLPARAAGEGSDLAVKAGTVSNRRSRFERILGAI